MLRRSYRRRLIKDELLVKCNHQHWRVITLPLSCTLLVLAAPVVIAATVLDRPWGRVLFGLAVVVGPVLWVWRALAPLARWYTESFAVTSRRVLFREGIVRRRYHQIDLVGVTNPELERSGWDLLFGTGTLHLSGDRLMRQVPRVARIERLITQLAANQTKDFMELSRLLKSMGYSKLTTK